MEYLFRNSNEDDTAYLLISGNEDTVTVNIENPREGIYECIVIDKNEVDNLIKALKALSYKMVQ